MPHLVDTSRLLYFMQDSGKRQTPNHSRPSPTPQKTTCRERLTAGRHHVLWKNGLVLILVAIGLLEVGCSRAADRLKGVRDRCECHEETLP